MKVYRTTQVEEVVADEGEESKIVIYTPPPPDDVLQIDCGNIMFAGAPEAAVSIVDPTGVEWDPVESPIRVLEVVEKFLKSGDDWLQLTTPKDGEPVLLHRDLVKRLQLVQCAKAQMRKDHMRVKAAKKIQLVQLGRR